MARHQPFRHALGEDPRIARSWRMVFLSMLLPGAGMRRVVPLVLAMGLPVRVATAAPVDASARATVVPTPALEKSRELGWDVASAIAGYVARVDVPTPGIAAFLSELRCHEEQRWLTDGSHPVDVEALVTTNPAFWRASHEVVPGDPAWLALHASLLLGGGEANRAFEIAVLAHQARPVPAPYDRVLASIAAAAGETIREGSTLVMEGVSDFDAGRRDEAMRAYEAAIAAWPQDALAHYELGLCHLVSALEEPATIGSPSDLGAALAAGRSPWHRRGAAESFARARHHDPLQWHAYQGDRELVLRLQAMVGRVVPRWESLLATGTLDDDALLDLAEGLQQAHADELALVARHVLVRRRGRYAPEDHPFLATSLRRLASGPDTEATLARLAGATLHALPLAGPWEQAAKQPPPP